MIKLEEIKFTKEHFQITYELLKQRKHFISHRSMPSYEEHCNFIRSKPYRYWYLVKIDNQFIGTLYLSIFNTIGININEPHIAIVGDLIKKIVETHEPLKEIKSTINSKFTINVPITNEKIINELEKIGLSRIQISYSIE